MPYYCSVPRCTAMSGKAKNVSFHKFPKDEELAKLWNKVLQRGKPITKYSKVCSRHFKPEDYILTSMGKYKGQWRTLRKDAIPSQQLPFADTPYARHSWNMPHLEKPMDQVAQAVYLQTMLAVQAAQNLAAEPCNVVSNDTPTESQHPPSPVPHSSQTPQPPSDEQPSDLTVNKTKQTFKCTECTKFFKDPDVYLIHCRSHTKSQEKENVNSNVKSKNETLKANPLLANLLKVGDKPQVSGSQEFSENLMATVAASMENYLRMYSTMLHLSGGNVQTARDNPDVDGL